MTATFDVFWPIVDGAQLEEHVCDTLKLWFPTYTREFEIQRELTRDTIPQPRSWIVTETIDREGQDQLPSVVVVSPGLNGSPPMMDGEGSFRATWTVGVGTFVSASTRDATKRLVRQYAAIIRAIMLQRQDLGDFADHVRWLDESYDDDFRFTDRETISVGQVIFDVEVDQVISRYEGPRGDPDPETQPGSHWPAVHTHEIEVEAHKP